MYNNTKILYRIFNHHHHHHHHVSLMGLDHLFTRSSLKYP